MSIHHRNDITCCRVCVHCQHCRSAGCACKRLFLSVFAAVVVSMPVYHPTYPYQIPHLHAPHVVSQRHAMHLCLYCAPTQLSWRDTHLISCARGPCRALPWPTRAAPMPPSLVPGAQKFLSTAARLVELRRGRVEYGCRFGCCVGPLPPVPGVFVCVVVLLLSPCSRTILRTVCLGHVLRFAWPHVLSTAAYCPGIASSQKSAC